MSLIDINFGDKYVTKVKRDNNGNITQNTNNETAPKLTSNTPDLGGVAVVGRDKIVVEIHEKFNNNHILVLSGQGGIGKTICSKYYANEHKNDYNLMRYMQFSSDIKTTLVAGCRLNEDDFEKLPVDEQFIRIKNYLESLTEKMLLMIDINEGVPTDLENLPQNSNIKILFTTRKKELISAEEIQIPNLDYAELEEVFINNSVEIEENDEEYLKEIIENILDFNTMVIALAAKVKVKAHLTMKELHDTLNTDRLATQVTENINHENKINRITEHILNLFSVAGLSIVEQEILRYMSLIDYGGVAIDKFKDWVGLEDYNFLNSLIDGGWIISSNKGDDEIIFMHPVISDAVFEQTKPNSENCKKLLEGIYEKEKDYRYLYQKRYLINILRFIINRIGKEETKEIADIYHILARITSTIDVNYNNCIENLKQAQKIYLKVLGEEHPDTAMSYNDIGFVYNLKDEYNQALEYYIKALNIREKILGKHQDTALSYNNIGSIYNAKSEYDKALEYHFKALEIRKKVLGEECSDTAISYNNIGLTYTNKGEYDNALEYLFKALNIREKVLEEEHPNIANSYNNIGFVYKNKGEYDIALDYYFKALEIKENVFGEKHPSTILTYKNIVVCYLAMGDEENASKYAKLAGLIE